jgi:signal transduction histidine kinase
MPLGVAYALVLTAGLMLDLLVLVTHAAWVAVLTFGRVVHVSARSQHDHHQWLPVRRALLVVSLWWRIVTVERTITMRWLNIDIPPVVPRPLSKHGDWREIRAVAGNQFLWMSLGYLCVKTLLGLLALLVAGMAIDVEEWTALQNLVFVFLPGDTAYLGVLVVSTAIRVAALYIVNRLGVLAGRAARTMLGPSMATKHIVELQHVVEQEHARANRAEQRRRDLMVNASHELRTPTASICAHVESLLLTIDQDDANTASATGIRPNLDTVYREAKRLSTLVDELLELARAETDAVRVSLEPVAPGEVIEEVYQTVAPLAWQQRHVTLVRSSAPDLPPVQADRQRLVQVLLNLVRNAINYTPTGGMVSISSERHTTRTVALVVVDTGVGIAPEELDAIFERFYQTGTSRTGRTRGFGLGLAIVRELVEAMGGTITVDSRVGEGSCFRVLLNIASTPSTRGNHFAFTQGSDSNGNDYGR